MASVDYWPKQQKEPPKVTEVKPKVTQTPPKQPPKKGKP
jgi:hypothetical protein